jgi:CheY-like chemotaxis protein
VIATGRTGRDAIVPAHEWMPDLVLMDIRMPEMTGLEAAFQLTRELPDIIVILMTAFEDEEALRASKESGAFAFVMMGGSRPRTRVRIQKCNCGSFESIASAAAGIHAIDKLVLCLADNCTGNSAKHCVAKCMRTRVNDSDT